MIRALSFIASLACVAGGLYNLPSEIITPIAVIIIGASGLIHHDITSLSILSKDCRAR